MSCPPENDLSIYVDGEYPLAEVQRLESHLMQCRRCRATVLALRDEVGLLRDVLHGRTLAPLRAVAPREQARGLLVGLAPALGVAGLVAAVGGWLLETNLPAGTGWLSPIRLMGAYEMVFDTIFMLRDRAPELVELAIAVGALFGVASVLSFLVGSLGNRLVGPSAVLLGVLGAAMLTAPEARAFDLRTGEEKMVVPAQETLSQTLIVSAESVRIDGAVEGDLFALAESIRIDGRVDGNVVAVGEEVSVLGVVTGSLYVGGELVRVEGQVGHHLYAFSEDITLHKPSSVGDDVAIFGERVRADGKIGRDLFFAGERIEVQGEIGRNLIVRGKEATLLDGTRIAGDFDSRMPRGRAPEVASGVKIGGERIDGVLEHDGGDGATRFRDGGFYLRNLVVMVSAFVVGMLLHRLRPELFESALPTTADFFRELGLGFVTLVVVPVAIVLCFVTVIGIPLGLIALFVFLTGLFVAAIMLSFLLGRAVLGGGTESTPEFGRGLLLGLLIVTIAVNLPFLGGLLRVVALMTGTGMLVTHFYDAYRLRST